MVVVSRCARFGRARFSRLAIARELFKSLVRRSCLKKLSSPASRARTGRIWRNCCSRRATRCTASSGGRAHSTPAAWNRFTTRVSFDSPEYTTDITATGTVRLLEAIRETGIRPRFYQASSSEMFGKVQEVPQTERTPFYPRSPYGCAKVYAHWITVNYRESYGLHANNGILFNHESPRRGETFVTRKITRAVAHILAGLQDKLYLGNLDAKRDWGYAREYVEAMWLMLQQDKPDDYVIATNETHSIREFLDAAFGHVGLHWEKHVEIDPRWTQLSAMSVCIGRNTWKLIRVTIGPPKWIC